MAKKAKAPKAAEARRRRTKSEVSKILEDVAALRSQGATIKDALKQLKISYSNYNYWMKKNSQDAGRRGAAKGKLVRGKRGSVVDVLRVMMENRAERKKLDEAQRQLDVQFEQLRKQLEKRAVR